MTWGEVLAMAIAGALILGGYALVQWIEGPIVNGLVGLERFGAF